MCNVQGASTVRYGIDVYRLGFPSFLTVTIRHYMSSLSLDKTFNFFKSQPYVLFFRLIEIIHTGIVQIVPILTNSDVQVCSILGTLQAPGSTRRPKEWALPQVFVNRSRSSEACREIAPSALISWPKIKYFVRKSCIEYFQNRERAQNP